MGLSFHRDYDRLPRIVEDGEDYATVAPGVLNGRANARSFAEHEAELRGDYLQESWGRWATLWELAVLHGWEPAGTDMPGMGYFSNEGARVTAEDGRELGAALRRALEKQPGATVLTPEAARAWLRWCGDDIEAALETMQRLEDVQVTDSMRKFIRFAGRGSFTIE